MSGKILRGDACGMLKQIPDESVHCCISSPPYWGLRSYLPKDHPLKHLEIGSEKTPQEYVGKIVAVFREVKRVLHRSGTVWLNLGDSYASDFKGSGGLSARQLSNAGSYYEMSQRLQAGLKPKDLCLIPWRVAIALQEDGWWIRSVIVWHKKSCMPESVTDRPTNSWEPIFLLAQSEKYFYDNEAVKEPLSDGPLGGRQLAALKGKTAPRSKDYHNGMKQRMSAGRDPSTRNLRNVWSLGPEPYADAHFAVFISEIPKRAILAGTSAKGCCPRCLEPWERIVEKSGGTTGKSWHDHKDDEYRGQHNQNRASAAGWENGDYKVRTLGWKPGCLCNAGKAIPCTVLDPFLGSGTVGKVAQDLGRRWIGIELNDGYEELVQRRTAQAGLEL